jgi:hypothetical protein
MQYLNTDAADLVPRVEIEHTVIFNTVKKPCRNAPNSDVGTGGAEPKDGRLGIFRPPRRLVRATVVHIGISRSFFYSENPSPVTFVAYSWQSYQKCLFPTNTRNQEKYNI